MGGAQASPASPTPTAMDHISNSKLRTLQVQHLKLTRTQSALHQSFKTVTSALENSSNVELMTEMRRLQNLLEKTITVAHSMDLNPAVDENIGFYKDDLISTVRRFHLYSGKPADPSKYRFQREDLKTVQIDELVKISIRVLDSSGRVCLEEQAVTAELHCIHDFSIVQKEAMSIQPDQYLVEITPKIRGRHMLAIKVNGKHIFGSPTPVFVHIPPQKVTSPIAVISGLKRPAGLHNWKGKILACEMDNEQLIEIDKCCSVAHTFAYVKNGPNELCSDSNSNIYVTTCEDNQLHKLDRYGRIVKTIGSTGKGKGHINGVKISSDNLLYVCDTNNHRVMVHDLQLNMIDMIGKQGTKLGQFQDPNDLAFDKDGNMYVADGDNNRIQVFSPKKKPLREYAVDYPVTICVLNDHLYVTNHYKHRVTVMTTAGDHIANFGMGYLQNPEGLEIDDDGFIYVTSHYSQIFVF